MKQAGLFDVRPVALAREQEPEVVQIESLNLHASAHPALRPDVLRVIVHKSGKPNPELRDGPTGREFWIVQLKDRTWVHQFTDGSRGPATKATTDFLVEQMLAGEWREVCL